MEPRNLKLLMFFIAPHQEQDIVVANVEAHWPAPDVPKEPSVFEYQDHFLNGHHWFTTINPGTSIFNRAKIVAQSGEGLRIS